MTATPGPLDIEFTATIGVEVKQELWSCVSVPDSREIFGTGKPVKVVATVDGFELSATLMPDGAGGHMLSLSKPVRARIRKDIGDSVAVRLTQLR